MTLKDLRIESGLKAAKVAEVLDISRTHLYNLENNKYRLDKLKIKALSSLYNKSEDEILKIIGGNQNE